MNLPSFSFNIDTRIPVYADDDPAYQVGVGKRRSEQTRWDALLTADERQAAMIFTSVLRRAVKTAKRAGIRVDVDNLVEAYRDYLLERRTIRNEYIGNW